VAVATHLADKSALARLHHPEVAGRLLPLLDAGLVGTCALVELEVLYSTRTHEEYEQVRADRRAGYEWFPVTDEVCDRALEVQRSLSARGQLRAVSLPDLLIAALAERHGLTVIHYDDDFDLVAAVTGQPMAWAAPRGAVP
jgi:predicted nucleic acid-binding protein